MRCLFVLLFVFKYFFCSYACFVVYLLVLLFVVFLFDDLFCFACLRFVCVLFMFGEFVPLLIACVFVVCVYGFVVMRGLLFICCFCWLLRVFFYVCCRCFCWCLLV